MREIWVTGALGGIGQYLIRAARARHPEARISTDTPEEPDVLIHAAASPYPSTARTVELDARINLDVLARAAALRVPRVVFLSSSTVYETAEGPLVEDAPCSRLPTSPIALSKLLGEDLVRAWAHKTLRRYTIWRLFNVVSPAERHDRPGHVQVDLYRKIFVDRAPTIEVTQAVRAFTWVEDVAAGIVGHLDRFPNRDFVLNLGSDEAVSVEVLAHELVACGRRLGLLPTEYDPQVISAGVGPIDARTPSIARARALGWVPTTSFSECVEKFVRAKEALRVQ